MQPRTTHAILVGLLVGCATPTDSSLRARVTEFGIYRRGTEIVRADAAAPSGQSRGTLGFRLLKSTDSIPPVIGTSFGFCYEVTGIQPQSKPDIVVEVQHPKIVRPDGTEHTHYEGRPHVPITAPTFTDCTGYGFDHHFELVSGTWKFTVLVNGSPKAAQEFYVDK